MDIFSYVNSFSGQYYILDELMLFSAEWLGYLLIAVLAGLLIYDTKRYFAMAAVAFGSAVISRFILAEAIRLIYNSPRPFVTISDFVPLLEHEATASMPSGHASFFFALAMGVYLFHKNLGSAFIAAAALMGFARVFVGVHWPTDILAGAVLGIVTAFMVGRIYDKYGTQIEKVIFG